MKKILVLLLLGLPLFTMAQKLGHINSKELVSLMPERTKAAKKLKAKQDESVSKLKDLQTQYQAFVKKYLEEVKGGTLSEKDRQAKGESIQEMEVKISTFHEQAQKDLLALEQSLLAPVIEKANKAIQAVATREGFTYIFDTSAPSVIFVSKDSKDILSLVKTELGL